MAENNMASAFDAAGSANHFKEAVCIEAGRIFDSCSDKDCLEDLQVFFTAEDQNVINASTIIKCKSTEVMDVYLTVEPVPYNRGFYTVDISFYFRICFCAYTSPVSPPTVVTGLACYCKKVILFGSEGRVRTFTSDRQGCVANQGNLPVATLKAVDPVTLGCRIVEAAPFISEPLGVVPPEISALFDGELAIQPDGSKIALVTLGLFTIVTLGRDMQMMVPAYDYCIPEKDCVSAINTDDPCEVFKRIKFPVEEFFPDDLSVVGGPSDD